MSMLWRVFLLLPVGFVPFTFGLSFIFQKDTSAMSMVMFINFFFAGIGSIAVTILGLIE
jgi:hypothetical protein